MRRSSHRPAGAERWYGRLRWERHEESLRRRRLLENGDWERGGARLSVVDPLRLIRLAYPSVRLHPTVWRRRLGYRLNQGPGRLP